MGAVRYVYLMTSTAPLKLVLYLDNKRSFVDDCQHQLHLRIVKASTDCGVLCVYSLASTPQVRSVIHQNCHISFSHVLYSLVHCLICSCSSYLHSCCTWNNCKFTIISLNVLQLQDGSCEFSTVSSCIRF